MDTSGKKEENREGGGGSEENGEGGGGSGRKITSEEERKKKEMMIQHFKVEMTGRVEEDNIIALEKTPVETGGLLFMDEAKVQGMLDGHSQSMKIGMDLQEKKNQEEMGKRFGDALKQQNKSLEIALASMSSQFQSQSQIILERFEQSLNGAMRRLTRRENELVKEIDEKIEQITEKQKEDKAKINEIEVAVQRVEERVQQNKTQAEQQLEAASQTLEGRMENMETERGKIGRLVENNCEEMIGMMNGLSERLIEQVEISTEAHFDTRAGRIGDLIATARLTNNDIEDRVQRALETVIQEKSLGSENVAAVNASLISRITALEHNRLTKTELERIEEEMKRNQSKEDNYWINSVKIHELRQARDSEAPREYARKELDRFEISHLVGEAEHVLVGEDKTSLRLSFKSFTDFKRAFSELASAGKRHNGALRFNQLIPRRFGNKFEKMRKMGKDKVQRGEAVRFFFVVKENNLGIKAFRTHRSVPEILMWERGKEDQEEEECLMRRRERRRSRPDPGRWGERFGGGREERRRYDLVPDRRGDGDRRGDASRGERERERRREEQRRDESKAVRARFDSDRVRHFSHSDAQESNRGPGHRRS